MSTLKINSRRQNEAGKAALLTPDIRLDGEGVVGKALRCGPFDGELGPSVGGVGVTGHQPAQAEIGNLHDMIFTDQAVPCCEIPER